MNGPSHYRQTEALLTQVFNDLALSDHEQMLTLKAAQVHATLALAAATAEALPNVGGRWIEELS